MDFAQWDKLISALAQLLWPLSFLLMLLIFYRPIKQVMLSAKARKFSLKIAGNELSMEEVTEQQRQLLTDLQAKVARLESQIECLNQASSPSLQTLAELEDDKLKQVLWVDDQPNNNVFLVSLLRDLGIQVHLAKSSQEALLLFQPHKYERIISDVARPEGDHAGLDLLKQIRQQDPNVPFIIYTGLWAASHLQDVAISQGATAITASGTSLLRLIRQKY